MGVPDNLCSGGHVRPGVSSSAAGDDLGSYRNCPPDRITDGRPRLRSMSDLAQLVLGGVGSRKLDAHPDCEWTRMDGVIESENAAEIGLALHRDGQVGELNAVA